MSKLPDHIVLNTGAKMPILGLGTWESPKDKAGQAVACAILECGYTHIDCAAIYKNEPEIGEAFHKIFSEGKIKREDIFITSKLWNTTHAQSDVIVACKKTLHDLQLDYLDLYLMHWSVAEPKNFIAGLFTAAKIPVRETWEAMEELVSAGLVRAIGVANFTGASLIDLLTYAKIKPAMNQIELHPYNQQNRLVNFCQEQGIAVTAYSPLGRPGSMKGRADQPMLIEDKAVVAIAEAHKKLPTQILIRWAMERNTVVIPKSVTPENIKKNIDVFNFELSEEEMNLLATLDRKHRFVDPFEWRPVPYFE